MAIDGARIQRVTKEGLFYLDEKGEEVFIDFEECYERKLAEFMQPESLKHHQEINNLSDEQLEKSIQQRKSWEVIGDKNIVGWPYPYIEFYSDPPIRFEFSTEEEFHAFSRSLREQWKENEWSLYDRS